MPKMYLGDPPLSDYAPVADRVALFYQRYPTGRILTDLHARTDREVIFVARVFRGPADPGPAATGWAAEREGDGDINIVACLENTETSAVGRALANLGFTASTRRPSREEMEKAARARARRRAVATPPQTQAPTPRTVETGYARDDSDELQTQADAVTDLLALLRSARHCGLRPHRADWIETRLRVGRPSPALLDRLGRRLRRWIASAVDQQLSGFATE